jgi:hypothetical protein
VLFAEIALHLCQHDTAKLNEATGWISKYLDSLSFQEYVENTGFFLVTANTWLTFKGFKNLFIKFSLPLLEYLSDLSAIERDRLYHITSMNTLLMQGEISADPPCIEALLLMTENLNQECQKYLQDEESANTGLKHLACLAATYFCLAEKIPSKKEDMVSLKEQFYQAWKKVCLPLVIRYETAQNSQLLIGLIEIGRVWHLHDKPNPIDRRMIKEVIDRIDQYYVSTLVVHYGGAGGPPKKEEL